MHHSSADGCIAENDQKLRQMSAAQVSEKFEVSRACSAK